MSKKYVPDILKKYQTGEKLVMVTAYDYTFASLFDHAGVDMLLVGDSLGNVVQGKESTLAVTVEQTIYHSEQVARAAKSALVIADMPFMSYQLNAEEALRQAGNIMKESGVGAVKLEGGQKVKEAIEKITSAGIPVVGHVGLTPQSIHQTGLKVQGRKSKDEKRVIEDARAVEAAGAFCVVLEGIPEDLARRVTKELSIPTIGIGAGVHCSGQVLVMHDLLGLKPVGNDFSPKFVKKYTDLREAVLSAAKQFISEVEDGQFPTEEHSYGSSKALKAVK